MNDKYFIDTNIFVYTFDSSDREKQKLSREIVTQALENSTGIISYQVIQEFLNVSTKKFQSPLTPTDCQKYLTVILEPLCEIFSNIELYHQALDIMERWHYSFYDSLIISAALKADCKTIYSEDLQHNQKIEHLTIINPYIHTP
ncbi:MAG: PIN domain-containing protein [Candidatus Latescibacteria bacterium]|nr:PIN domain-containing protein [Candidatus Latescibacterota bacterium]